jgi:Zn-finger nucleic acid-binding protein
MKRQDMLFWAVFIAIELLLVGVVHADTGTYTIEKQFTNLTVHTSGDVDIAYYVKFRVDSGNIPWVRIGLPNADFSINNYGGAASAIRPENDAGWSGVYITLDKTYYAGNSFDFYFSATQHGFIYKYNNNATIEFTPVYWDYANTEQLAITVILPPTIKNVTTSSEPTQWGAGNSTILWQWSSLGHGERKTIGVIMPLGAFNNTSLPDKQSTHAGYQSSSSPNTPTTDLTGLITTMIPVMILLAFVIVLLGGLSGISRGGENYESPSVSVGGDKEITRHLNMVCPNDKSPLDKRTVSDTTIDYCDTCGGCWFDKGEIESLITDGIDEKALNTNGKDYSFQQIKKHKTVCPRCEGKMHKKSRAGASIFVCENCEGIWLDRGTYQKIKDKRAEQESLQKDKVEKAKQLVSGKKTDEDREVHVHYYPSYWWWFYPYIGHTGTYCKQAICADNKSSGGSESSSSSYESSSSSCACVSCACVAACACACACAGGSAAGCSPKNKFNQISLWDDKK